MKQITRVLSRPEDFPSEIWEPTLAGLYITIHSGVFTYQNAGVFGQVFIDKLSWKLITTILIFDTAEPEDTLLVTQALESIHNKLSIYNPEQDTIILP